jgi:membrane-associated protein
MGDLFDQLRQLALVLFDSQALMQTLGRPEFLVATFVMLTAIVFIETGLLFPFLPGDSLLVTAGLVFHNLIYVQNCSPWLLPLLLVLLCTAAVVGECLGYYIGAKAGPRIFRREKSFFFRKDHLLAAQRYYEKHGGKTIVVARFMPLIRTFAPVVAGAGQMNYRRFMLYNLAGGVGWVCSMILVGLILTPILNPALRPLLGDEFKVEKHIEKVIILVVLVSIAPGVLAWAKHKLVKRKPVTTTTPV